MPRTDERAAEHTDAQMHSLVENAKKKKMHRGGYIAPRGGVKGVEVASGGNP
jgi:hypothetical protein